MEEMLEFKREKNKTEPSVLYLVATPIGNLADLSERAKKVLSEVDFIAAEDTRNSQKLLSAFGIKKPMISYHEHNRASRGEEIVARLGAGESCALITDAGTPAISDPGEDIVRLCIERGLRVTSLPGCSAGITALTLSGMSTRYFAFEGFLPTRAKERRERLSLLSGESRTTVLYEAPHRLRSTLSDMAESLGGERRVALCRELTKLNEEVLRMTLGEALTYYSEREPRGEYVIVLEGATPKEDNALSELSVAEHIRHYTEQGLSEKEAIRAAARDRGVPKNVVYNEFVRSKQ